MKNSIRHLDVLDYVRGIAILSVLLFHTLGVVFGFDVLPWNGWLRNFSGQNSFLFFLPLSFGQAGVAIFFVVSGFCIHLSFHQQGQNWRAFFIRRTFRIYPAYLAAVILFVLFNIADSDVRAAFDQEFWKQLVTHLFLVQNADHSTITGLNPSLWSLAIEAQLYLLYPALIFLAGKIGWRRSLFWLGVCELLIRGADGSIQTLGLEKTMAGNVSWVLSNSPLGYWCSWALGAYLAEALLKHEPLPFANCSMAWWSVLALTSYFIRPLYPFIFFLFALLTAIGIARLVRGGEPAVKIHGRFLTFLKRAGLMSYSLYLLHQPLLNIYSYLIVWAVPEQYRPAPVAFLLILMTWFPIFGLALFWHRLFELPGIAFGKRVLHCKQEKIITPNVYPMMAALIGIIVVTFIINLKLKPLSPEQNNNLAWSFATNPSADKRDGLRAIKLAEDACRRTQSQKTVMVGTLAAAYAEAGRFDDAIATATDACRLASMNGETNLLEKNQSLLILYRNHRAYHGDHE